MEICLSEFHPVMSFAHSFLEYVEDGQLLARQWMKRGVEAPAGSCVQGATILSGKQNGSCEPSPQKEPLVPFVLPPPL